MVIAQEVFMHDKENQWFVVQTLSGHEMKAKESIEKRLAMEEMEDLITETLVPMEKVTEVKLGKKTTTNRKFFPGYILLNATLYDENNKINEKIWTFIQETNGIIGFVGGEKPVPLSKQEINDILEQLNKGEAGGKPRIDFDPGEIVKIRDGAFENFEGRIESIDPDRGKLKLSVSIFGRFTPVEVEYWQVERT